ncbi:miaA [Symbiodinium natans]|uniref:MiaA protein n=1 Tax=Symbiodinium natans TaxID=878477 RepID=A0A812U6I6_9DINO|nr:miaA [Symbiodinium natans]
MYLDWLVKGEPDAAKSARASESGTDPAVQAQISEELRPFQDAMDWDGALSLLASVDPTKASIRLKGSCPTTGRRLCEAFDEFYLAGVVCDLGGPNSSQADWERIAAPPLGEILLFVFLCGTGGIQTWSPLKSDP